MRKTFADSKAFAAACAMPAGQRHQPDAEFDWSASEVAEWLCQQPAIRKYIFDKANQSGAIIYDKETGTWGGRDSG